MAAKSESEQSWKSHWNIQWFVMLEDKIPLRVTNSKDYALAWICEGTLVTDSETKAIARYREQEYPEIGHKLMVTAWGGYSGHPRVPDRTVIRILGPYENEVQMQERIALAKEKAAKGGTDAT